jgi:hypothetical protein
VLRGSHTPLFFSVNKAFLMMIKEQGKARKLESKKRPKNFSKN